MVQFRIFAVVVLVGWPALSPISAEDHPLGEHQDIEQRHQNQTSPWVLPVYRQMVSAESERSVEQSDSETASTDRDVNLFDLAEHDVTFRTKPESQPYSDGAMSQDAFEAVQAGSFLETAAEAGHSSPTCEDQGDWSQCCGPDCPEFWEHRSGIYGEFIYLTARDANLSYTVPVDGTGVNAVPIGRVGVADPDYEPGFRVGGSWMLDSCTSLTAEYTHYESSNFDRTSLPGGAGFLRAELVHPHTTNVATDSLSANAAYDIDFDLADLNYKGIVWGGCDYSLNYLLGFRYANLDQDLQANYLIEGATTVDAAVDFDGFGPRVGLEGERLISKGFLVYGKGFANFLAGDFDAEYRQTSIFSGTQATTGIEDDRIVSLLELEIGLGWQSQCGRVRATAGYYVGSWFNTLTMPEFINGVQADNLDDLDDTLTFDGLTTRLELRY